MNLRGVRSHDDAVELLGLLGYDAAALPYDATGLGLEGDALRLRSESSPSRGYGVLVAELAALPRSLRTFGRRLVDQFHDRPLALLGVRNGGGDWGQVIVVRPRLIAGRAGAVSIAKLTIDVGRPTSHDAEVVRGLAWDPSDPERAHERINQALDVERVTRRFFLGLNGYYQTLLAAVRDAAERDPAVLAGLERGGGAERVALRIVTQTLFCYFLQRKGLLEGDRGWLSRQFVANLAHGSYYARVLEPLFYETLAKPQGERQPGHERPEIPFLNGGLFERHYGDVSLPLPDDVFSTDEGLLGFLDGWTFTVSEEAADESEVAVDPEMLGKIFENLIAEDEMRREGTVYTPRPVVQFMCREALVSYLERQAGVSEERARELLLDDEALVRVADEESAEAAFSLARRLDDVVARIRVLDPAVGSGAFPLGMMSELIRLRRLAHRVLAGIEPGTGELWNWKLQAIERSLFGVDIRPEAIELCRLRLWLSLLVEEQPGDVHPLPNLEYRTVCADSLRDFVAGVEVQQTRSGALSLGFDLDDPAGLVRLRERYFEASDAVEKNRLREELAAAEDEVVEYVFERALENAREASERARGAAARKSAEAALETLPDLRARFRSRDRRYPVFLPAFHAPDVAAEGGWDVVIMNPPYVGRRQLRQRYDASFLGDLERHYGRTYDLMLHFGFRALELARAGGVVSMIFNDSIFTSVDAAEYRRKLLSEDGDVYLLTAARTRCFERAVNGGVVVASKQAAAARPIRWVENYGRPPVELGGATVWAALGDNFTPIGRSELWVVSRSTYLRLPHRPLFRPSPPADTIIDRYEATGAWSEFSRFESGGGANWQTISFMPSLERWREQAANHGFYATLHERFPFVFLGLVIEGGPGLQTSDDRRFLAAIDGTDEADAARRNQKVLEERVLGHSRAASLYRERRNAGRAIDSALLDVALEYRDEDLRWPRSGLVRVASRQAVRTTRLTPSELDNGIVDGPTFIPFEKGDDANDEGGSRWRRDNPLVIDWSRASVALLRSRAQSGGSYRKPLLTNQDLWGAGGVTYNGLARYLRARLVPEGAIFGHMAPILRSVVDWLPNAALLSLLNAPVLDFTVRTFISSLMHIEASDLRRLPIPVLTDEQAERLVSFTNRALRAKEALDRGEQPPETLSDVEAELDDYVRDLYGIPREADLWVVR